MNEIMTNEDAVKILEIIDGKDGVAQSPSFVANGHLAIRLAIEALKKEPSEETETSSHAQECYDALCDYFQGDPQIVNTILNDRGEFQKWLERLRWNVKKCDELSHKLESIKNEPSCEDAISRKEVNDKVIKLWNSGGGLDYCMETLLNFIAESSATTPIRPKGHWIFVDKVNEHAYCSACDYGDEDLFDGRPHNYCPKCGADMREVLAWMPLPNWSATRAATG